MTNKEIARILFEMAALWEMEGVEFKPRAYEKAALAVEATAESLQETYESGGIKALMKIPGIGRSIAEHIEELCRTGRFREYDKFKKKIPVNISELMQIEGLGPRMIKSLWIHLHVRTLEDLEKAARAEKIRHLDGFGIKSEQRILKGIEFLKKSSGRQLLGFALPEIRNLETMIQSFPGVQQAAVAGSVRRAKETIGDIDLLVTTTNPHQVIERFLGLPLIEHVYGKGSTKINVKLKNGLDADLRIVPKESFGAALCYFTGSKDHNIALREMAVKKGWKLNEYGLFKGKKMIAGRTEEEIYRTLGLAYVEPEMREHTGEIEAARKNRLPRLIEYGSLKGDLQVQTNWTDGEDTIEKMAVEAEKMKLEYIAITDHTKSLAMTGGSDEKKLMEQMEAIDDLNRKLKKKGHRIRVLKGAEVNIMKDGSLDIQDEVLGRLEVVGAAVHHYFNLTREEQTRRVIRAMKNPHVDILFHLTSRLIQKREPIQLDVEQILQAAKETGTVLEIDAFPDRLDIKDEYIRRCVESGVKLCIDSDAHSASHMRFLELGVAQARRGWAEAADVVNTLPVEDFLAALK
jgi:DNA polymerase (family 10)